MCAATDPANFEFEFGYKTVPGFNCNVWHRPPLPPAFKTPDGKEEYGVIADSFCMSRNPFDRLASQYRYRASVDAREAPPTCDAFSDFVDEHLEKLESNALLACLKRGVVAPAECQYHIRARLTRENKLSLDEIDDASSYGAEDCHFLPQTMYTRACETVFELEEYDAAVAPFLEKALSLPPGTAASAEAQSKKAKAKRAAAALGARDEAAPSDAQKALEYLTTGDPAARAARVKADEAKAKAGTDGALSAAWAQNLDAKDKKEAAEEPKRRSSAETRGGHRSSSSASKQASSASKQAPNASKQASSHRETSSKASKSTSKTSKKASSKATSSRRETSKASKSTSKTSKATSAHTCTWADVRPETMRRIVETVSYTHLTLPTILLV